MTKSRTELMLTNNTGKLCITSTTGINQATCEYLVHRKIRNTNQTVSTLIYNLNRSPTEIPFKLESLISVPHKGHYFNYVFRIHSLDL